VSSSLGSLTPALMVVGACCLLGCQQPQKQAAPDATASAVSASSGAPASSRPPASTVAPSIDDEPLETVDDEPDSAEDPNDACAPVDPKLKPMQLLRFTFSDAIKDKDPGKTLHVARPGQRVYAHLRMRNRSGRKRCMHVIFRVGGNKRTEITLTVGKSWSWRTWAYNTLKRDDRGPLSLEITDDQGKIIVKRSLAVVPE
jgi:hypothetical protein